MVELLLQVQLLQAIVQAVLSGTLMVVVVRVPSVLLVDTWMKFQLQVKHAKLAAQESF
jgi:hypothetical protein|tara:strand:+ start:149 stop:322 length:174 start_codon:yes stop_codon:yes gene_type:complete